jgi:isochorismate synthase
MPETAMLRARTRPCADPGDLLARAAAAAGPFTYWEHPAGGRALLALGVAREIRTHGEDRFATASAAAERVLATIDVAAADRRDVRMVAGFAFSAHDSGRTYPPARVVLPRRLWIREGAAVRVTDILAAGEPDAPHPPSSDALPRRATEPRLVLPPLRANERERWRARVERTRDLIAAGTVRKVVLARRRTLEAAAAIDPAVLVARARAARPGCFTVWVRARDGSSFVASTPELLVRRAGPIVTASALAGSAPRAADAGEDARLAAALLACPKNAREHALVVSAVREALAAVAVDVTASPAPSILRLPEAQHLATAVVGRLRVATPVLALAGLLHPTPAVCGTPRDVARALIEREEPERGWYAGALGWMDAEGDGELAVALRSALVAGRRLTLWAGAGIVEGSDADAELAETEAKMRALVAPFLASAESGPRSSAAPDVAPAAGIAP